MLMRYLLSETSFLICNYDKWSGSGVDELLYFLMVSLNSSFEKGDHSAWGYDGILLRNNALTWQC